MEIGQLLFLFYYIAAALGIVSIVWFLKFRRLVAGVTGRAIMLINVGVGLNVIGLLILVFALKNQVPPIAVLHDSTMFVGLIFFLFAAKQLASLVNK